MPEAGPLPLSVSIVCRDNETTIERTLRSVAGLAGEIVAVDSGSRDATIAILERYGARVVHQEWLGHVKQKQLAMDLCTLPWVLHLDSDESLEEDLRASVRAHITADPEGKDAVGAEINRKVFYAGKILEHAWQPEWRLRCVPRGTARWGGYDPHDKLEMIGARARTVRLAGTCRHDSIPSMADFLARQVSHARIAAESYRAMGRKPSLTDLALSPVGAWLKQMVGRRAYKDGWRGWTAATATAAAAMMKHAILFELTNAPDPLRPDTRDPKP